MGHSFVPSSENALYGYKGDLRDALSNGSLPRGFELNRSGSRRYSHKNNVQDEIEQAKSKAQDFGSVGYMKLNLSNVPDDVASKISVTREDAQNRTGFKNASVRHQVYQLRVAVGPRGGIKDIQIGLDCHH